MLAVSMARLIAAELTPGYLLRRQAETGAAGLASRHGSAAGAPASTATRRSRGEAGSLRRLLSAKACTTRGRSSSATWDTFDAITTHVMGRVLDPGGHLIPSPLRSGRCDAARGLRRRAWIQGFPAGHERSPAPRTRRANARGGPAGTARIRMPSTRPRFLHQPQSRSGASGRSIHTCGSPALTRISARTSVAM